MAARKKKEVDAEKMPTKVKASKKAKGAPARGPDPTAPWWSGGPYDTVNGMPWHVAVLKAPEDQCIELTPGTYKEGSKEITTTRTHYLKGSFSSPETAINFLQGYEANGDAIWLEQWRAAHPAPAEPAPVASAPAPEADQAEPKAEKTATHKCIKCGQAFDDLNALLDHFKANHPDDAKPAEVILKDFRQRYESIPVDRIEVSGNNPRKAFDEGSLMELTLSIKTHGILEPLVVRPVGAKASSRYELVAGERRYHAAQMAKLQEVPCIVRQLSDAAAEEIMLLENLQREDLQPLEIANALQKILSSSKTTQEELGKKIGKSQGWISNHLRLLKAPEDLQQMLISQEITPRHAQVLMPFAAYPAVYDAAMKQLGKEAKEGSVPVSRLEQIVTATIGNDYHGDKVLNFTNPSWNHKDLLPFMDKEACKACDGRIDVELGRSKNRVCLRPECFKVKIRDAELSRTAAREAERKDMIEGKEAVNLDLLSYGEYDRLKWAKFDLAECQGCKSNRKTKTDEEVCLDSACFKRKSKQHDKDASAAKEDKEKQAVYAANSYIIARSGPLNARELRLILETICEDGGFGLEDDAQAALEPWTGDISEIEIDEMKELTDAVPDEDLPKALLAIVLQHLATGYNTDHRQLIKDIGELGEPSDHVAKKPTLPEPEDDEEEPQEDAGKVKGYSCPDGSDDEVYGTLPEAKEALDCDGCSANMDGECDGPEKVFIENSEEAIQ